MSWTCSGILCDYVDPATGTILLVSGISIALVLVFIHIRRWNKRMKSMMREYANSKGFSYKAGKDAILTEELKKFTEETDYYEISFWGAKDAVSGDVNLFRCKLNNYDKVSTKNRSVNVDIICATFNAPKTPAMRIERVGKSKFMWGGGDKPYLWHQPENPGAEENELFDKIRPVIDMNPPKHRMAVMFNKGGALIFLQPLVVGGEKIEDIDYLYEIAVGMKKALV